jgi:predicted DNA-binding protein YlxM (UPF0122 family)
MALSFPNFVRSIVEAYKAGQSTMQEVADRFAVKRGWVNEIIQRYNQTGRALGSYVFDNFLAAEGIRNEIAPSP